MKGSKRIGKWSVWQLLSRTSSLTTKLKYLSQSSGALNRNYMELSRIISKLDICPLLPILPSASIPQGWPCVVLSVLILNSSWFWFWWAGVQQCFLHPKDVLDMFGLVSDMVNLDFHDSHVAPCRLEETPAAPARVQPWDSSLDSGEEPGDTSRPS